MNTMELNNIELYNCLNFDKNIAAFTSLILSIYSNTDTFHINDKYQNTHMMTPNLFNDDLLNIALRDLYEIITVTECITNNNDLCELWVLHSNLLMARLLEHYVYAYKTPIASCCNIFRMTNDEFLKQYPLENGVYIVNEGNVYKYYQIIDHGNKHYPLKLNQNINNLLLNNDTMLNKQAYTDEELSALFDGYTPFTHCITLLLKQLFDAMIQHNIDDNTLIQGIKFNYK